MDKVLEEVEKTEMLIEEIEDKLNSFDVEDSEYLRLRSQKEAYEELLIVFNKRILKNKYGITRD